MSKTYTIKCMSTAVSPISHMQGTAGNEAIIARERVMTPSGVRDLPVLSGNALRHRMVREPGARFLIGRWGLVGKLTMRQLNFLFHGGALSESTSRVDTRGIATFHRLFPLYRLLGSSLPDAILPGALIVDRGLLICRENFPRIRAMVQMEWEVPPAIRPSEAFVGGWQYTRGDAINTASDLMDPRQEHLSGNTNLMIYNGGCVIPGAVFLHGFIATHAEPVELGALLLSIALWRAGGGTIGGQSGRGHGKLDTLIHCDPDADAGALMADYVAHVDAVKDEAIAWLDAAFAPPKESPKGKRGKSGQADLSLGTVG